jgi:small conductance mechanosensitive channel
MTAVGLSGLETLAERFYVVFATAALFVASAVVVYLTGRFAVLPAARWLLDRSRLEETFVLTAEKMVHAAVVVFAAFVGLTVSGLTSYFAATSAITAAATIAIGFAAQDVLGNLVSGVFIVLDPEFHVGDWIRWNGQEGVIEDISFRVTRVHTFDNELITVPNGELTKHAVVNPVAKDRLRVTATFGVGYGEDVELAREVLVATAQDTPGILARPGPTVRLLELGESAMQYQVRFWIEQPARADLLDVRSRYVEAATERLTAAGVELPYPTTQLTGELGTRPVSATE